MSSRGKIEKWLFAEWSSGRVVNSRSMVKVEHEVSKLGSETGNDPNHVRDSTENISNGRCLPEEVQRIDKNLEEDGLSAQPDNLDFSSSASSWEPSDENDSSEESEEEDKKAKLSASMRQYCNKRVHKKGPVPAHRANPVIPNVLQPKQLNTSNKRRYKYDAALKRESMKSLPDSTRKSTPPNDTVNDTVNRVENVNVNVKDILEIKASFRELFQLLNDLKPQPVTRVNNLNLTQAASRNYDATPMSDAESDRSHSDESNRSDDNVLITNKYDKAVVRHQNTGGKNEEEWVPIGSGKTLIHKDKYRKINWRSYTIATRTLLLATFPRRILATHSLTGKRSPAFQNKPAKMCLDPKIVSDVIIEITSRFKVKENLVRSIITTKCADECKMYKLRLKQKGKQSKDSANVRLKEEAE